MASMSSQLYVKQKSAALIKYLNQSQIAPLEGVPVINSPYHTPAPPPLHHILLASLSLGHQY